MKKIELRRHSIRNKPGDHLSPQGVALARRVGQNLGPFERVMTSTLPRAFETAIAMGFAVDVQNELMSTYGPVVEWEVSWPATPREYAKAVRKDGASARYAYQLRDIYCQLVDDLSDGGAALVINHGGVLELGAVACLPNADHESWGPHFDYCEGVRLFWDAGKFVNGEVLRVST